MKLAMIGALAAAALATPAVAGDVTVSVSGVQPNNGQVWAVLQRAGQFAKGQGAYQQKVAATGETVQVTFRNVAPGTYAAAAIQDTNKDNKVAVGAQGPREPWGLSGSPQTGKRPVFGPASQRITASGGSMSVALNPM